MRGTFITLEGGEGCGKSTQARLVRDWLAARGRSVVLTREPGGTPLAEAIREIVLRPWPSGMSATTETLLMFAARAAHIEALIEPELAAGHDVICDRFIDSTYAYQGGGKGVASADIAALEALTLSGLQPDLTLVLDMPVADGLARARARGDANRFEGESISYMERVRDTFLQRARNDDRRCALVDARGDVETVFARIRERLEARL